MKVFKYLVIIIISYSSYLYFKHDDKRKDFSEVEEVEFRDKIDQKIHKKHEKSPSAKNLTKEGRVIITPLEKHKTEIVSTKENIQENQKVTLSENGKALSLLLKEDDAEVMRRIFTNTSTRKSIEEEPSINVYENTYKKDMTPVDILWVIDDSGSMEKYQKKVADKIKVFVDQFLEKKVNFKIAIITTSVEVISSGNEFTTNTYTESELGFKRNIQEKLQVGGGGIGEEQGLTAVFEFLSQYGGRFLRNNSKFVTIFLTDENDSSYEQNSSSKLLQIGLFINNIEQYLGAHKYEFYSIIEFPPSRSAGTRYAALSYISDGFVANIDGDFHQSLLNIGGAIIKAQKE